ncbi:hypothetical protein [Micromonospora arida]
MSQLTRPPVPFPLRSRPPEDIAAHSPRAASRRAAVATTTG